MKSILILLLFISSNIYSQDITLDSITQKGQIDHSFTKSIVKSLDKKIVISNSLNSNIHVSISLDTKTWKVFKIKPMENLILSTKRVKIYYLKIYTYEKYRSYKLLDDTRNAIVFDSASNSYRLNRVLYE